MTSRKADGSGAKRARGVRVGIWLGGGDIVWGTFGGADRGGKVICEDWDGRTRCTP